MRYLMTFSYDGTNFYGYQKQIDKRTVQEEIERVLSKINNQKVFIYASGRTDAKVHALNQRAHFDLEKIFDLEKLKHSMNQLLPNDIYIKEIKEVDNSFHARFDIKKKTYVYKINLGEYNPIDRNYIYQYNKTLNVEKIKEAFPYLIGEHNFKTFTKATTEINDYIRTIYAIDLKKEGNIITITFIGNGFLRYMIRNMVGTLMEIGEEKVEPNIIEELLKYEDRTMAFKTAAPEGLYLADVEY